MKRLILLITVVLSMFFAVTCFASPITTYGPVWLVDMDGDGDVSLNVDILIHTDYSVGYLATPGISSTFTPLAASGNILDPGVYDLAIQKVTSTETKTYALSDGMLDATDFASYNAYDVYFSGDTSVSGVYSSFRITWTGMNETPIDFDFLDGSLDLPNGGAAPSPVPIPPSALLFCSGLLGVIGLRKKASR